MNTLRRAYALLASLMLLAGFAGASAYNAKPKLVVILVIDQFRGDLLERYHDEFQQGGFRLLTEQGAWFTDCNYEYANTRTGPGHATIGTGSYTIGHGILSNEWWDGERKELVESVHDRSTRLLGVQGTRSGASPRNLMATTLGDELRMATQGRSRVYGISLKDRAAILPVGFSANAAFWVDTKNAQWITSTYYMESLPSWVAEFNQSAEKTISWATPAGNDFILAFARALIARENLGRGPTTDLVSVSLSPHDMLGHEAGPDTPQMREMALALDRQLAAFFRFLDQQLGLSNVWVALTGDHGGSPAIPSVAPLRIPVQRIRSSEMKKQLNEAIAGKTGRPGEYVAALTFPIAYLSREAFGDIAQAEAEKIAGEAMVETGLRGYFTKSDLAGGKVPSTQLGRRFANSYSPYGGWYVLGVAAPFSITSATGSDHALPYSYDTHVPLAFYGAPFRPGLYRQASEPIDLASTLAVLLGINRPSAASGRVLTEALRQETTSPRTSSSHKGQASQ